MSSSELSKVESNEIQQTSVQWQRWWILGLFSLLTMWQCAIWNTFGPIAQTVEEEFGWTEKTLTGFTWWAVLDFPLFFLPSSFILSRSLRYSVLAASSCSVIGATIR